MPFKVWIWVFRLCYNSIVGICAPYHEELTNKLDLVLHVISTTAAIRFPKGKTEKTTTRMTKNISKKLLLTQAECTRKNRHIVHTLHRIHFYEGRSKSSATRP